MLEKYIKAFSNLRIDKFEEWGVASTLLTNGMTDLDQRVQLLKGDRQIMTEKPCLVKYAGE